jgi:hypothetical protein
LVKASNKVGWRLLEEYLGAVRFYAAGFSLVFVGLMLSVAIVPFGKRGWLLMGFVVLAGPVLLGATRIMRNLPHRRIVAGWITLDPDVSFSATAARVANVHANGNGRVRTHEIVQMHLDLLQSREDWLQAAYQCLHGR